jgi:uncharacterized membrane protein YbhN (UPF0104 family)
MSDPVPEKKPAAAPGASAASPAQTNKVIAYSKDIGMLVGICAVILVSISIAFIDPETAQNFLYFLYGLDILLVMYLGFLFYKLLEHTHKFNHHVEHLLEMYDHSYKPLPKKEVALSPVEERFQKAKNHVSSKYR